MVYSAHYDFDQNINYEFNKTNTQRDLNHVHIPSHHNHCKGFNYGTYSSLYIPEL